MAATAEMVSQRDTALAWANRVRTTRARIKREVHAGVTDWRDVLDVPELAGMRLYDLLDAMPYCGPRKIGRAFTALGIVERALVGNLTARQRAALLNTTLLNRRRT